MNDQNNPTDNNSANNSGQSVRNNQKKTKYKGFTFKERLLPSILLSLLAPLTVCFAAPFEIFGNNLSEFKFVLGDFWGLCVLIAIAAALVLLAILLPLRGRVFDAVFGLIFGLSLMFFIQSNYLSLTQTSLEGDGTGSVVEPWQIALNTVIWVLVTVACVAAMLLLNKHKDTVRLIATMALAVMLFMTFVSFLTISLTTDVFAPEKAPSTELNEPSSSETDSESSLDSDNASGDSEQQSSPASSESESESESETEPVDIDRVLTVENLNKLASKNNIIVFVVDRFSDEHFQKAMELVPEVFDECEGFTFFNDYISRYPRTFPAIPHLITGVENDFSLSREEYFKYAYTQAPMMHTLKDAGFDINIYTDSYYGYENASDMAGYTTNVSLKATYKIINKTSLSFDMLRLALYRSLPAAAQPLVGDIRTTTFDKYVEYDAEYPPYNSDMKEVYTLMSDAEFTLSDAENNYSFIHIAGCHLPNAYDENFEDIKEEDRWDITIAMKTSFKIINRYLSEMKRLGVYEDSTILIMGDHCSIGSDKKYPYYPHLTGLMVKPAGVSSGEIVTSSAPISPEDVFATILDAAGADMPNPDTRTVFEIGENEIRTRSYFFQSYLGSSKYEEVEYKITGPGNDLDNWEIVNVRQLGKSIYD